ncbi:hypothetical protein GCM10027035_00580 [Emticicia sediminis]
MDKIERVWNEITPPNDLILILNPVFNYNSVETGENLSEGSLQKLLWWGKQVKVYLNEAFIDLRKNGGNHVENPVCRAVSTTIVIFRKQIRTSLLPSRNKGI